MSEKQTPGRRTSPAIITAVLLILALPAVAYVAGYFWLGNYDSVVDDDDRVEFVSRDYPQQWMTTLYQPAGKVEAWLRRIEVTISGPDSGRL